MKFADTRLKKTIIITISAIIVAIVVILALISPITKYLIEKYDERYFGRQITMNWVYLNPFTGYVHISDLKIYESKQSPTYKESDGVFFSAEGVSGNFSILKLLSKTIEISEITIDHPKGIIIQNENELNFSDLIKKFTPEKLSNEPSSVHFNIRKIKIIDGEFHYREKQIPIIYFIKKVNLESTGKLWNADTIGARFSLVQGFGSGDIKGDFTINMRKKEYRFSALIQKFDLNIIEQYLKDLTNYGRFTANLDADISARGSFLDEENVSASGLLAINQFHFGKNSKEDYVSFEKLVFAMKDVSPKNHRYIFDSVSLSNPFVTYERYDYLDNLQMMFGKDGANIAAAKSNPARFNLILEIADYVKLLVNNFLHSYYKVDRLAIYNGNVKFCDYSIHEKFTIKLYPLGIIADSVDKNHKRLDVSLQSGIKPYGNISLLLSVNPLNSSDFDLNYHVQKLPTSVFNPYLITYTSYPVDRGTIELKGKWNVRNGVIQSDNHFVIIDPRVNERIKNKDSKWLPLPLIMSLIREGGNVIDYTIPITGSLKDPKFHLNDVLIDLLENIFVKTLSTPYRYEVRELETEIENSLSLMWKIRQRSLLPDQDHFIKKLAKFLIANPTAKISVYPIQYVEKEKEYIGFFEAKKKYYLLSNHKKPQFFSQHDSLIIENMSAKDTSFVHYLTNQVNDSMLFTVQEKCDKLIGIEIINLKFRELCNDRKNAFLTQFKKAAVVTRVQINTSQNDIPYNGFSFYKISYKGQLPASLSKAYRKMNDLDDMTPRKKYKKDRTKNKSVQ